MLLRYVYRLDPSPAQRAALARAFGCARLVYNEALSARQAAHEAGLPFITDEELSARLTKARNDPQRPWLAEVSSAVLQQAPAEPSSVAVIKDAAGRYFASFVVNVAPQPLPQAGAGHGIDLGLHHFAVLDDGTKVSSPRFLRRAEKKLRRLDKSMSRKQQGSKNWGKARAKVARVHAKVADARRDFHHKLSTEITQCGTLHDRDVNAAKNILAAGRAESQTLVEAT